MVYFKIYRAEPYGEKKLIDVEPSMLRAAAVVDACVAYDKETKTNAAYEVQKVEEE